MDILMNKIIFYLIFIIELLNGDNYVFLMQKSSAEIELEAKIVSKIAKDIFKTNHVVIFMPNQKQDVLDIYSQFAIITNSCEEANLIFIKDQSIAPKEECIKKQKLILTNNYKRLLSDEKFSGAFFWSKARPNIVFSKSKLAQAGINLPTSYSQFVEEF